jgi:hypothetical protein
MRKCVQCHRTELFFIYAFLNWILSQNIERQWDWNYKRTTNNTRAKTWTLPPQKNRFPLLFHIYIYIPLSCLFLNSLLHLSVYTRHFSILPCTYFNSMFSSCCFLSSLLRTGACLVETLTRQMSNISLGLQGPGVFYLQHGQFTSTTKQKEHFPDTHFSVLSTTLFKCPT